MTLTYRQAIVDGVVGGASAALFGPLLLILISLFAQPKLDGGIIDSMVGGHGLDKLTGLLGASMITAFGGLIVGSIIGGLIGAPVLLYASRFSRLGWILILPIGLGLGALYGAATASDARATHAVPFMTLLGGCCALTAWKHSRYISLRSNNSLERSRER